tara:strand:- start:5282 stop:5746 length:465 start_codon:yes stop_codon:yes gene_type:complete
MERRVGVRALLLGRPLCERSATAVDPTVACLNHHLTAVQDLLPAVYGEEEPSRQARMEWGRVVEMPCDDEGVWCKRAALLFALRNERELGEYFASQERRVGARGTTYAEDLQTRVLPFVTPLFLRNSCQTPDAFVILTLVLSEMWAGEALGNWA